MVGRTQELPDEVDDVSVGVARPQHGHEPEHGGRHEVGARVRGDVALGGGLRRAVQRRLDRERGVFGRRDDLGLAVDRPGRGEQQSRRRRRGGPPRARCGWRSRSVRGRAGARPTRIGHRRWRRGAPPRRRQLTSSTSRSGSSNRSHSTASNSRLVEAFARCCSIAGREVVDHEHAVPGHEQCVDEVRSDEPRAARDHHFHRPHPMRSARTRRAHVIW